MVDPPLIDRALNSAAPAWGQGSDDQQRYGCGARELGVGSQGASPRRPHGGYAMPRYMVERTFPNGLSIPPNEEGAKAVMTVVGINAEAGVTWVHSYVPANKKKTTCIYAGPSRNAIKRVAERNKLPIEKITEVRVLDPY